MGRGLGAARPVPLVRMAVGGSGNRLVPLTGFALRVRYSKECQARTQSPLRPKYEQQQQSHQQKKSHQQQKQSQ